jgi:hypothetical protein
VFSFREEKERNENTKTNESGLNFSQSYFIDFLCFFFYFFLSRSGMRRVFFLINSKIEKGWMVCCWY